MWTKQNLASALGFQKEYWGKLYIIEIIKLQFGKERHTLLCISSFLQILFINYLLKCVVTSNFPCGFQ